VSLLKRGNTWWAYFYQDGIRHQESTGTSSRKQAEAIEKKLKEEANLRRHQVVQVDPNMTFGELVARFIANASPKGFHLEKFDKLLPYFCDVPITHINKGMVLEYRKGRHAKKPKLTVATVNRDIAVLRHLLYWAVDNSFLVSNPLTRVPMVRERRVSRPVVSLEEELQMLKFAPAHLRLMIITALDSGMRRGEILHQIWEHVDFGRRVLYVTRSKTPEGEAREIPMTGRFFRLLSGIQKKEGTVFTFHSQAMASVKTAWKSMLKRASLRHLRFHDLRHTFNTRLMEAGVMQEVRKAIMGHTSGGGINAVYTHVELPSKRKAIASLEAWYAEQLELIRKGGEPEVESERKVLPAGIVGLLPAGTGSHPAPNRTES
jgi:integrase